MTVRYAPSPTGRLHIGNLRTALAAALWARRLGEPLVFRYEDIDRERASLAFLEQQRLDFASIGIRPDVEEVQSIAREQHWQMFRRAITAGALYPCFASRKEVNAGIASAPHGGPMPVYDGRWRDRTDWPGQASHPTVSWRFRSLEDNGSQDFIVARTAFMPELWKGGAAALEADAVAFLPAYHWACAFDDYRLAPRLIVRAWDLEHALAPQRQLHALFTRLDGGSKVVVPAAAFHTSLVVGEGGRRLEKRTAGVTLNELAARGHSAHAIAQALEASFSDDVFRDFEPAESFGEAQKDLPLTGLGLT